MPVRVTVYLKKLDPLTEDEFHDYWVNKHVPLFLSVPSAQRLLISYSHYTISDKTTSLLMTAVGAPQEAAKAEFNGVAEFMLNSIDDFVAISNDPVYLEKVAPDDDKFIKRAECMMLVGHEKVFFKGRQDGLDTETGDQWLF